MRTCFVQNSKAFAFNALDMFLDYRNDKWRRLTRSKERDAVASQRQNEETAKPVELRPESKTRKWFCIILTFRRTREERFCRVRRNLFHAKTPRNLSSAMMSLTSLRRFWEIQFLHKLEKFKMQIAQRFLQVSVSVFCSRRISNSNCDSSMRIDLHRVAGRPEAAQGLDWWFYRVGFEGNWFAQVESRLTEPALC